jgi:midasin
VIVEFTFKQKVTNVSHLMENLVKLLEVARNRAPQMETMQLVFIISDGRFSEKDGLKRWIRQAEEKNMLIVFIIIDNPKNKGSILDLQVNCTNTCQLTTRRMFPMQMESF